MKHLHFNNYAPAKQDPKKFAMDLFDAIMQTGTGIITMSIDDGDGDIWKYTIDIDVEHMKNIVQIKEN
jgi:hypothetical protein